MSAPVLTRLPAAAVATAILLALVACSSSPVGGDKAGGAEPPLMLTIASPDDEGTPGTQAIRHFAEQVSNRSGGRISIRVEWSAAGSATDFEGEVIRQVLDGEQDLGWVGTRAWDRQGISGFSALQAPFLISDYAVLDAVMRSEIPGHMLAELEGIGLTGLGVYPDQLRHPLGFRHPFLALEDFDGAQIRVPSSNVSDDILRSLGAVPVHLNGPPMEEAIASGELAGAETSIGNASSLPQGGYMTMNVTFYPKLFTLFAASDRYRDLSEATQSVLQAAADDTLAFLLTGDLERSDIQAFCELGGTLVNAEANEVDRMIAAAAPVRREMEADPQVAAYLGEIVTIRSVAPAPSATVCPP